MQHEGSRAVRQSQGGRRILPISHFPSLLPIFFPHFTIYTSHTQTHTHTHTPRFNPTLSNIYFTEKIFHPTAHLYTHYIIPIVPPFQIPIYAHPMPIYHNDFLNTRTS